MFETKIRTRKNKTRERSVAGKPTTSAPLIVISQVVSVASCKKIREAQGWFLMACRDVSKSSNTCLGCVASLREDATGHIVPVLILRGEKVFRTGSCNRSGGGRAVQER